MRINPNHTLYTLNVKTQVEPYNGGWQPCSYVDGELSQTGTVWTSYADAIEAQENLHAYTVRVYGRKV